MSQGFPDFDPPKELTDELARIAKEGPHQYSITYGAPNFRAALAEKQGIRDQVKIMVGGAPVTAEFAAQIGADAYTDDAASAANQAVAFCS